MIEIIVIMFLSRVHSSQKNLSINNLDCFFYFNFEILLTFIRYNPISPLKNIVNLFEFIKCHWIDSSNDLKNSAALSNFFLFLLLMQSSQHGLFILVALLVN